MRRVIIIGCCGSGKSTLAARISPLLGLPVVNLDRLFWREGWQQVDKETFDGLLKTELEKDEWIIDGNFARTLDTRLERADTVIYLDFPSLFCVFRVLKRVFSNLGRTRPDMGDGCPERLDIPFLIYTLNFNRKYRDKIYKSLEAHPEVGKIILKRPKEVKNFVKSFEK